MPRARESDLTDDNFGGKARKPDQIAVRAAPPKKKSKVDKKRSSDIVIDPNNIDFALA